VTLEAYTAVETPVPGSVLAVQLDPVKVTEAYPLAEASVKLASVKDSSVKST